MTTVLIVICVWLYVGGFGVTLVGQREFGRINRVALFVSATWPITIAPAIIAGFCCGLASWLSRTPAGE